MDIKEYLRKMEIPELWIKILDQMAAKRSISLDELFYDIMKDFLKPEVTKEEYFESIKGRSSDE